MTKKLHLFLLCAFALLFGSVSAQNYVKVTSAPADWSGDYLIVYEDGSVALNGGLTDKLDKVANTVEVNIANDKIEATDAMKAAQITIVNNGDNYTLQSASGFYFGQTSNANGLASSKTTKYTNTLSLNEDGTVNVISSGGAYLRYNFSKDQTRFRYYKSSTYTQQKAITLYKYEDAEGAVTVTAPSIKGKKTFVETLSVTLVAGEGAEVRYTLDGTTPDANSTLYTAPITLTETTTVKAVAIEGGNLSEVSEATFTKVVPEELAFADLCNLTADKKEVKVNFNGVVVAFVDGGTVHLREGENAAALYNIGLDLQQGQVLEGYIVADFKLYNSMPELVVNNDLTDVSTISLNAKPAEVTPYVVSVADLNEGRWMAHYVQLRDVTIETETVDSKTTTYIVQGEDKIACYKGIDLTAFVGTGKTYDVDVLFNSIYKGIPQVKPLFIEEVVVPANTLTYASVSPENNSTVTSLSKLSLTFEEDVVTPNATAFFKVYNEENARVAIASFSFDSNDPKVVNLVLDTELTAAGTYTVTFAEQSFWNNKYDANAEDKGVSAGATYNPEFTLTYTIEKPVEPEVYPVNFDKDASVTRFDRNLQSITLTPVGGETQTLDLINTGKVYNDLTEGEGFVCEAGAGLKATFNYSGSWMHGYIYLDFANDGEFSFDASQNDQTGKDLVSYSFFGPESNEFGQNSDGTSISGDARSTLDCPIFHAPETPGTYRMRYKIDWNNVDAGGCISANNHIIDNGGYIVDAKLTVVEATGIETVATKTSNKVYTIDGRMVNAKAGEKLAKGLYIVGGKKIYVK
ncbi:MAG: chitobiase/beta-hexosaminidase C-terminal domain-containing protein [Bacteroidaceae bacterium]|nr:chitobiase/beta-hexosaminidase C-terminal domain-containing protein [Bacteroidaceae bacterium]